MTFIIPPQATKQHSQTNQNDLGGTIFKSRNISLDEKGYVKLSEATYTQFSEDEDVDFNRADAMMPAGSDIFVNADEVFSGDLGEGNLTNRKTDTGAPSPGVEEDIVYFNETEVVSDGTSVYYRSDSTTWTAVSVSGGGFSSASPTCMTVWDAENTLCVGNTNIVKFINTSWAVNGTILTIPKGYKITSLASAGSQLFIATRSISGGDAKVFVVNTIATSADSVHSAETFEVMSMKPFKSSVAIINSLGKIMRFNGGGFDELAILPICNENIEWSDANNDYSKVSNRAMVVDGELIYVNLSAFTENNRFRVLPNFPAGIWCYDDNLRSFYHKHSPSFTKIKNIGGSDVTVNATDNTFTLTSGNLNDVVTGMPLLYKNPSTLIPELTQANCYFVIKVSSTVFKLAKTYADAIANIAIDITGVGSGGGQDFIVFKTNDYGWTVYDDRMSIVILNSRQFDDSISSRLAYTAELASKQAISTNKTVFGGTSPFLPNRGYFITPKLESSSIEDTWQRVYIKHRPLGVDDKIIVKYKSFETYGFPFSSIQFIDNTKWKADWTNTTTFTTTTNLSSVSVGDEIEITGGVGSGHIAFITAIEVSSGTYTVTLDEAFPFAVSGDEFYFQVDKWIKLGEITSEEETTGYKSFVFGEEASCLVQLKIELRGNGTTVSEIQLFNKTHTLNNGV